MVDDRDQLVHPLRRVRAMLFLMALAALGMASCSQSPQPPAAAPPARKTPAVAAQPAAPDPAADKAEERFAANFVVGNPFAFEFSRLPYATSRGGVCGVGMPTYLKEEDLRAAIERAFQETDCKLQRDYAFDMEGVRFVPDGYDPEKKVGYILASTANIDMELPLQEPPVVAPAVAAPTAAAAPASMNDPAIVPQPKPLILPQTTFTFPQSATPKSDAVRIASQFLDQYDSNRNGIIDGDEYDNVRRPQQYDTNRDEKITLDEIVAYFMSKTQATPATATTPTPIPTVARPVVVDPLRAYAPATSNESQLRTILLSSSFAPALKSLRVDAEAAFNLPDPGRRETAVRALLARIDRRILSISEAKKLDTLAEQGKAYIAVIGCWDQRFARPTALVSPEQWRSTVQSIADPAQRKKKEQEIRIGEALGGTGRLEMTIRDYLHWARGESRDPVGMAFSDPRVSQWPAPAGVDADGEPLLDGLTPSHWIAGLRRGNPGASGMALDAINEHGARGRGGRSSREMEQGQPRILPAVVSKTDEPQRVSSLITKLSAGDSRVRDAAANQLRLLGPAAQDAVAALSAALSDPAMDVRWDAAEALAAIGPGAASASPALAAALSDDVWEVRLSATYALTRIGEGAVPALLETANQRDPIAQLIAVEIIGQIGTGAAAGAPLVAAALQSDDPTAIIRAAYTASRIGPAGVPGLIAALPNAKASEMQDALVHALVASGPGCVPALIDVLQWPQARARHAAARVLYGFGPAAAAAIPALRKALRDDSEEVVRSSAAHALGSMGKSASDALPDLVAALKSPNPGVRWAAIRAVVAIERSSQEIVALLVPLVADSDNQNSREAIEVLGRMGPAARDAVPALIVALSDARDDVRRAAANALLRMGPDAKPAVPVLADRILHPNGLDIRDNAAILCYLGWMDTAVAAPAVARTFYYDDGSPRNPDFLYAPDSFLVAMGDDLVQALIAEIQDQSQDWSPRLGALQTLQRLDRNKAVAAAEGARKLLLNPEWRACKAAATLFLDIDTSLFAPAVVDAILLCLHDGEWNRRDEPFEILARTGGVAKSAVPDLLAAIRSDHIGDANSAIEALVKIDPDAAREHMPLLIKNLHHVDNRILANLDPQTQFAKDLVPVLIDMVWGLDYRHSIAAAKALGQIDPVAAQRIVTEIVGRYVLFPDGDNGWEISVLSSFGPAAGEALPLLKSIALDQSQCWLHLSAAKAWMAIDPESTVEIVAAMIDNLHADDESIRKSAIEVLISFGPAAQAAVPALMEVLRDPAARGSRFGAVSALCGIGPAARPVVPLMIEAIRELDRSTRGFHAKRILQVGLGEQDLMHVVQVLWDGPDSSDYRFVAQIGPPAIPVLERLLADSQDQVRWRAEAALDEISWRMNIAPR